MSVQQAVILAGGRGQRLLSLTEKIPKPMVLFHDRPFLEYLVMQLKEQGVRDILMLLGYKAEVIQGYFGDGGRWQVSIRYSVSPEEDETGKRLQRAASQLNDYFLMMYCDNYWPFQLKDMWERFQKMMVPMMVTAYANRDKYSKNNVEVDEEGYVIRYDKARTAAGLNRIDIGYAIMHRSVIERIPDSNANLEASVYPQLVKDRALAAFPTEHRYYSIGSADRFPETEKFLAFRPAVILDRDGVINKKPPKAHYVKSWPEFEWLPGAIDALHLLKQAGFKVIIVSNQAGIAFGAMTEKDLQDIHARMRAALQSAGADIDAIYHCPHGWDEGCFCRKPNPGMLFQAQREHQLDLTRTVIIGDDERDAQAGAAAGCRSVLVTPAYSLLDCVRTHLLTAHGTARS